RTPRMSSLAMLLQGVLPVPCPMKLLRYAWLCRANEWEAPKHVAQDGLLVRIPCRDDAKDAWWGAFDSAPLSNKETKTPRRSAGGQTLDGRVIDTIQAL